MIYKNVDNRYKIYFCTGCGACEAICLNSAIKMIRQHSQYLPEVDESKCITCGICLDVCQGLNGYVSEPGEEIITLNKQSDLVGSYLSTYTGYTHNETIRYNSASGGIATQLLVYLIENNFIDGAIVSKETYDNGELKTKTSIVFTAQDVISASSSIYAPTCPVKEIKHIAEKYSEKRFAFVGLPCHIQSIRKLQEKNNSLKNVIRYCIGLFCSRGVSFGATEFLISKYAKNNQKIIKLTHRGKGWPGKFCLEYDDGSIVEVPHKAYWPYYLAPYFFTLYRCLVCDDLCAEYADISLGDAWLKEITREDKIGTSMIVARNSHLHNLLNQMMKENIIILNEISIEKMIKSQGASLRRKKEGIGGRIVLFSKMGLPVPENIRPYPYRKIHIIGSLMILLNTWISGLKSFRLILRFIPKKILISYKAIVFKFN